MRERWATPQYAVGGGCCFDTEADIAAKRAALLSSVQVAWARALWRRENMGLAARHGGVQDAAKLKGLAAGKP